MRKREVLMRRVFFASAMTSVLAVALICLFLFAGGIPAIARIGLSNFLGGTAWKPTDVPARYGILPMILGSVYVTAGAIALGVPIGLLTAAFMAYYCPRRLYRPLKSAVQLLAGIPSVVYGFFGLMVIVPGIRALFGGSGNSILAASALLGLMILPTIVNVSESAIAAVPREEYENALALGATRERALFRVVIPAARSGVLASVVLGVGRAIGETMAVIMVAGNNARMPKGLLKGIRTLTANIVIEMGYAADLHRQALIATGVVLFAFILLINLTVSALIRRRVR